MKQWKGNSTVFKGYATGNGKSPSMKVKNAHLLKWENVKDCESFGAILNDGFIDISFDSDELSQQFWDMSEKNGWKCLILENSNGHIHSYWKNTEHRIEKGGKDKKLAVGLIADIHSGSTYIPLKVDGVERFPPSFEPEEIDEVPDELIPVNTQIDLANLGEGDGRNDELFKYILILQSQLRIGKERIIHVLNNINDFIFDEPLSAEELETIARDEAFEKPIFYEGKAFLHDQFANYMKSQFHIKRINGQLHIYDDGIYVSGYRFIESKMISVIPTLKATQRTEVLKYLEITTLEQSYPSESNLIAFRNGILDLTDNTMKPFSPEFIITNKIPWDYNVNAYSELCDNTLNKISCNNPQIRSLLEECVGYTFFRENELSKSFMLTGDGANGKSTYLDMIKNVLGRENYVALDLDELSERFSTATMYGKLANIGDDISDEFLQGKQISVWKKVISGNDMKFEQKNEDPTFFKPSVKLLFSANDIPRMRNRGFKAIKRRLVIIPFNATFSKDDPDYDSRIVWKLKSQDCAEYLIRLGIEGLKRVLHNQDFSECDAVNESLKVYEEDNNPVIQFIEDIPESEILNHETKEVFRRYDVYCSECGFSKVALQTFSKEICRILKCKIKDKRIENRKCRVFQR